jgi:hypothetical protein
MVIIGAAVPHFLSSVGEAITVFKVRYTDRKYLILLSWMRLLVNSFWGDGAGMAGICDDAMGGLPEQWRHKKGPAEVRQGQLIADFSGSPNGTFSCINWHLHA